MITRNFHRLLSSFLLSVTFIKTFRLVSLESLLSFMKYVKYSYSKITHASSSLTLCVSCSYSLSVRISLITWNTVSNFYEFLLIYNFLPCHLYLVPIGVKLLLYLRSTFPLHIHTRSRVSRTIHQVSGVDFCTVLLYLFCLLINFCLLFPDRRCSFHELLCSSILQFMPQKFLMVFVPHYFAFRHIYNLPSITESTFHWF